MSIALLGASIAPRDASADEPPTTTAPSRIRPGVLHLDRADLYLGLETDYERRRVKYNADRRLRPRG